MDNKKRKSNWMKGFIINSGPKKTVSDEYEMENMRKVKDRKIRIMQAKTRR